MSRNGRPSYEVRIRVETKPGVYVKKSKFYNATGPGDARGKYKGPGHIMWVEKVKKEKLLGGVGEFFRLGDSLLQELRAPTLQEQLKIKVRKKRGYYDRQRKKTTNLS